MILFFDEDIGTTIPRVLRQIGMKDVKWLIGTFPKGGTPDVQWLTEAGRNGWLVFSCNKQMLQVEVERETIVKEKVGIVFLTSGQELLPKVLQLVLKKWDWFEDIDKTAERPFAFYLYPSGRTRRVPL